MVIELTLSGAETAATVRKQFLDLEDRVLAEMPPESIVAPWLRQQHDHKHQDIQRTALYQGAAVRQGGAQLVAHHTEEPGSDDFYHFIEHNAVLLDKRLLTRFHKAAHSPAHRHEKAGSRRIGLAPPFIAALTHVDMVEDRGTPLPANTAVVTTC